MPVSIVSGSDPDINAVSQSDNIIRGRYLPGQGELLEVYDDC